MYVCMYVCINIINYVGCMCIRIICMYVYTYYMYACIYVCMYDVYHYKYERSFILLRREMRHHNLIIIRLVCPKDFNTL